MKKVLWLFFLPLFVLVSCQPATTQSVTQVSSPDGNIVVSIGLNEAGQPQYWLDYKGQRVIEPSTMGFTFAEQPELGKGMKVVEKHTAVIDEQWIMPWGEQKTVINNANQLTLALAEESPTARAIWVQFQVYNDGIGFRYFFPEQAGVDSLFIVDEHTQFQLTGDHTTWWIPGDWDIYEHLYTKSKVSAIDAVAKRNHDALAQTYIPYNAVNTPVTMRTADGIHLSFHEANLTDYAGMTLQVDTGRYLLESKLVQSERTGLAVQRALPFYTPWRTIQIADQATDLIASNLIVNLNEPNRLGDIKWFTPTKYVGIWWDMHVGTKTWDYASGNHGATTTYAKEMIDFAAQNNIGALLVEGWNTGWEHWIGFEDREGVFDFVTPYPDYDLTEVVRYGKEKGVALIMHHETSAAPRTYEQQLDTAYSLMEKLGIHAVKTGYVGKIIPKGEYHHGQWMVNHYRKVLETAAQYQIAINAHEPIKATGIRRTLPNAISREGLRGQEFNAWSSDGGNPPNHLPTVAFTRMLAGPIDYTPGIFNIKIDPYKPDNQVNTTLAQQLALYVVIYSPVQMAADLLDAYRGHPAFQFIRDVAVDWEQSHVLNGEIGEYVTIARQERDNNNWFIGSITNEEPRELAIALDFLPQRQTYHATLYLDGENAHWDDNPTSYRILHQTVTATDTLKLPLAAGGGAAISLLPE